MEVWRDIPEHEGYYQVSDLGNVRSLARSVKRLTRWGSLCNHHIQQRNLTACPNQRGYVRAFLTVGGVKTTHYIHRLVAVSFLTVDPLRTQVNHKDGNKSNNKRSNLEWCNSKENISHAISTGLLVHSGADNSRALLTEEQVGYVRQLCSTGMLQKDVGKLFNVTNKLVSSIITGGRYASAKK